MLCSVAAAFGLPAIGIENYEGRDVWRGIMTSKNTLGFWSAITILACAVAFGNTQSVSKKLLLAAGIALAAIALINSVSATSLLSLIVSALVMSYLYVAFRFDLGLISTLVLGVFAVGLAGLAFYNIDTAELIGRSGDLTGRGDVWNQVWKLIMDKPLTGYGYGTIWYPTEESVWIQQALTDFTWKVFHAHNGLLQIASEIGIPLTFIAVIMIIQQLIEIVYCQYQRQQAGVLFVLGFTVALLVSNYSEARLLVNRELYWIFFIALPISMLQQVHVIAAGARFNPMPAPLHKRTRGKIQSNASDREYRRKLKRRLNDRLQLHDGGNNPIPSNRTSASPGSAASEQAKLDKPNDQQKKTGS